MSSICLINFALGGIPVLGGESFLVKADFEITTDATFPPPAQYTP
jgi:hypothetical protein